MEASGKSPGEDLLVFIVTGFSSGFALELGCCVQEDVVSLPVHTSFAIQIYLVSECGSLVGVSVWS